MYIYNNFYIRYTDNNDYEIKFQHGINELQKREREREKKFIPLYMKIRKKSNNNNKKS